MLNEDTCDAQRRYLQKPTQIPTFFGPVVNFQASCVEGDYESESLDVNDDTLLACSTCYTPFDSLELAGDDADNISIFVAYMLGFTTRTSWLSAVKAFMKLYMGPSGTSSRGI